MHNLMSPSLLTAGRRVTCKCCSADLVLRMASTRACERALRFSRASQICAHPWRSRRGWWHAICRCTPRCWCCLSCCRRLRKRLAGCGRGHDGLCLRRCSLRRGLLRSQRPQLLPRLHGASMLRALAHVSRDAHVRSGTPAILCAKINCRVHSPVQPILAAFSPRRTWP